ncbi:hypothetical protein [Methylobacter svalbardensis]|uniref:hypothetical protein n=1 Tax=Methylobacter svalbardensis TaxID=3080016 RepID=UPI0030EDB852
MNSRIRKIILAMTLSISIDSAEAICFNPLGCTPTTEAECIKDVANAKTEAAAKAMIAECRKLPKVTLSQCRTNEKQWAEYMSSHGGVEWEWRERSLKTECKKNFPETFLPSIWVTRSYCQENTDRLAQVSNEVDARSLKSARIEKARRAVPEMSILNDREVIEYMQSKYYQDMSQAQIAAAVFFDAPPEPIAVAAECERITGRLNGK